MASDLLSALITATLVASAAIVLVILVRAPVRRAFGPVAVYRLWLVPAAAVLASFLPAAPRPIPTPQAAAPVPSLNPDVVVDWIAAQPAVAAAQAAPFDWSLALLIVWGAGAVGCATVFLHGQHRTVARFGRLTPDRIDGAMVLRTERDGHGPAVIGVFRPRLIIPSDFETRFDPTERELILAHERAHLAAFDPRINGLIALARCLNWFNPLVHYGAALARVDQELARDAAVVASNPGERRVYAEALLKSQLAPASLPLGCYWPVRSSKLLKERIEMLAYERPGLARRLMGAAAATTIAATAAYAAWAAEPQQQVAALSPRTAVTAATPAPRPTTAANSFVLPKPTAEQLALITVNVRPVDPSTPFDPLRFKETIVYTAMHMQRGPGPRFSEMPLGSQIEDVQSLWLADGSVIPEMRMEAVKSMLGTVAGERRPPVSVSAKYTVDGDTVTVDEVLHIDGRGIAVQGLKVRLGETAVVRLTGGHILSVSPRLSAMNPRLSARLAESLAEQEAEGENVRTANRIDAIIAAGKPAASPGR